MLVVLLNEGLVLANVSVVHAAASSSAQQRGRKSSRSLPLKAVMEGGGHVAGGFFSPLSVE
jgi:hypothetical protein